MVYSGIILGKDEQVTDPAPLVELKKSTTQSQELVMKTVKTH